MADHDDEALAVHDEVLQPLDGLDIQVVGGLVQEDDVRLSEEGLGQQHLHLLLGGEGAHLAVQNVIGEAKALDQAGDVALSLPAAHLGEFRLQLAGPDAVGVGEVLLLVQGVLLLHDVVEVLVAQDDGIQHGVGVVLEVVLLQNAHAVVLGDHHLAGGGLQIPGEDAQKGGLAGAVGADDAVAVAGDELEVHVLEERLAGEVQGDVVDSDHSGSFLKSLVFTKRQGRGRSACPASAVCVIPAGGPCDRPSCLF